MMDAVYMFVAYEFKKIGIISPYITKSYLRSPKWSLSIHKWLWIAVDSGNWQGIITSDHIQGMWGLSERENGPTWAKIDKNWAEIYKILFEML